MQFNKSKTYSLFLIEKFFNENGEPIINIPESGQKVEHPINKKVVWIIEEDGLYQVADKKKMVARSDSEIERMIRNFE